MSVSTRRVTLADVARATGYTVNTVSRALKNKSDISRATCETIQRVADEMGYVSNYMASSLRSGRSRTLGVIVGGMSNPFYSIMVDYLHDAAAELGYTVLVMCSRDHEELELKSVASQISRQVDGILLYPSYGCEQSLQLMRSAGTPFVLVSRTPNAPDCDCAVCDEEQGGYLAAKHLIEAGHRKLAFLFAYDVMYSSERRIRGFRHAADEAGIPPCDLRFYQHTSDDDTQRQLLAWRREGVTGLFTFCDMEAWNAISLMHACGLSVPGDFSVVGFDNIQGKLHFPLPLCTIDSDMEGLARAALRLLISRVDGDDSPPRQLVFPSRLVCRESCGARADRTT
ncbi:MAG: LacI family DNA-binding transcriptional regulator [Eubacteriales bacterium]|nr:LacI family DNA-binding transcriptional regulator [Eubacteriales bacterium]